MMDAVNSTVPQLQGLLELLTASPFHAILPLALLLAILSRHPKTNEPPRLWGTIPVVSNSWQYMTNMPRFLERATQAFRTTNIFQFRLGHKIVYMVTGDNVLAMFRSNPGIRNEIFMETAMEMMWAMPKNEIAFFHNDKSGRGKIPAPGTEGMPANERHWAISHRIYDEFLTHKRYSNLIAAKYFEEFSKRLETRPLREWQTVRLMDFLQRDMAESAIVALFGPKMLELNPGFINLYWEFDKVLVSLVLGLPHWLNPRPRRLRDRLHAMTRRYVESAWENFDWNDPDAVRSDWDEHFGARVCRELAKWLKNFSMQTNAGFFASFLIGQNSNTLPTVAWALVELVRDPELFQAVRAEVHTAYITDPDTGARNIDAQKLMSLPLLQSVYTEIMRLHISVNITREVTQPMTMDGYDLKKGAVFMVPTQAAHYDEKAWSSDGHTASEFWAARHVKYVETRDVEGNIVKEPKFSLGAKPSSFFPFGGGVATCPGRHFARQEILMTLAILVARFHCEFVEWTNMDGSRSDRPAGNDDRYNGSAAMPPDRDMKIRWKRLW